MINKQYKIIFSAEQLADKIIKEMQDFGLSYTQMLEVIALTKNKLEILK
jgi:hypothetical protein